MSSLLGLSSAPAVRRPAFELRFGSGSAAEWAASVTSVAVDAAPAPAVDAVEIVLAPGARAPTVAVGDRGSVSLGYEGTLETVFTGAVTSVRRSVDGPTRVLAVNAGAALARLRVEQSFEQLTAGEIVSDLVGRAGADARRVDAGVRLAFYVVDDRRSAWAHVAALARVCGYAAFVGPDGGVVFGPPAVGPPAQSFAYAVDVLSLSAADVQRAVGAVKVVGEGAAGSAGADAAAWFVKDASGVTGSAGAGAPARLFQEPALRTGEAAQAAADAAARATTVTGRLVVPGAPSVTVGSAIEVRGAPESALDGVCTVRAVRHRYGKRAGFLTTIDLVRTA